MGKRSPKTEKIKAALAKGTSVSQVAAKYDVTTAYVYALRRRMDSAVPTPSPAMSEQRAAATQALMEGFSKTEILQIQEQVRANKDQLELVAPTLIPPTFWEKVRAFFRSA